MNSSFSYKTQKSRAQTMVEFALALPILLTLLYGVLETGRLLFIYASTVTAARQAVRYGSATGTSPNGPFYYQDCVGIKAAAQNVGFINRFEDDAIEIWYDTGPQGTVFPQCPGYSPAQNGDRIVVSVETQWQPIVPIVPLQPFTIRSQSARTILASISIVVEQPGVPTGAGAGVLQVLKVEASQLTYSYVGEIITYTYTLTNSGSGDLSAPYNIQDDVVGSFNCPGGTLAPGDWFTCSMTYQITPADLDAGVVTNTVTATAMAGDTPTSSIFPPGTETITLTKLPGLTLSKSADPDSSSTIGAIITYTYALENTGNVPLRSPYSVTDDKIPNVSCAGAISPLPVGNTTTCTGTYQLTVADIANGSVVNNATATATYESADVTSNTATATVITTPLVVWITPSPGTATLPNQVITYTYTVRNNSENVASSLIVTSTRTPSITCSSTSIPVGGTVTCTGTYTVTQADLNTGEMILNSASATANGGSLSSNIAQSSVLIVQNQSLSAAVSASPSQPVSPATSIPAGTEITYSYVLTNSGNVTLTSPFSISDDKAAITCANQANLEPNETRTCTGTHVVTDEDVAAGSITNTGTASANFGAGEVSSDAVSFTVITFSGARFGLSLSANPEAITYSGTSVVFTYTITNTGGITLASPYTITSDLLGVFNCAGASPLAPGASTSCQNSYTTSNTITNTITAATAMDGGTQVNSSNLPSITVPSNICTTGSLTLSAPVTNSTVVTWTINNTVGTTLNITAISLTWSTGGNTYLSEIEFPAPTTIWFGSDKDGFQLLSGSWPLPEGTTTLRMTFTKNNPSISDMTLTFDEAMCGPLSNP